MSRRGRKPWLGSTAGLAAAATILTSVLSGPGPDRWLRVVGAAVGLAGVPLAFLPFLTLRRHGRSKEGGSYLDTTEMVDVGLYSVVRHPQYLAYILWMATFSLLSQRAVVIGLGIVAATLLYLTAVAEEGDCLERWGEEYGEFLRRVPRLNIVAGLLRKFRRLRSSP